MSTTSSMPGYSRATRARLPLGLALILSFFAALVMPSASLAADSTPPKVDTVTVSPNYVFIGPAQTVTVTFHVTDPSGVVIPAVSATSDLRPTDTTGLGQVSLVSGTAQDGIYKAKLSVGAGAVGGGWTVTALSLADLAGNVSGPVVLGHFTVIGLGFDNHPPVLADSSLSPTSVDVTGAAATITATLHITDDYAGTKTPVVTATSSSLLQSTNLGTATLVSGDKNDGIWSVVITIPQHAERGPWAVRLLGLSDQSGNLAEQIISLGSVDVASDLPLIVPSVPSTNTTTNTTTVINNSTTTQTPAPAGAVLGTKATSKSYITLVSTSGKNGLKIAKSGSLTLKLHCTGVTACRGSVRVYFTSKGKKYKVVSRRVSVKANATIKTKFKLTLAGRKVVKSGKKAKTSVSIWTDGIAAPRTKPLTVRRAVK